MVVSEGDHGERLDRFLASALPDVSRSQIQKHIEAGAVMINGRPPLKGAKTLVTEGAVIVYEAPAPLPVHLVAQDIPIGILYEDADLIVVDKPADLVVHPAVGHPSGTLVNALIHHIRDFETTTEDVRPGIVHRLDRDTTGAMVVAKHAESKRRLVAMFQARTVEKSYEAIVRGLPRPPADTIETLYGRHPRDRKRFSSKVRQGKTAVTRYRVAEVFPGASHLEIALETGRTHQIRVHMADRGHPLVGDGLYGRQKKSRDKRVAEIIDSFSRPALHARRLAFDHPMSGKRISIESDIPSDFRALLEALRAASKT